MNTRLHQMTSEILPDVIDFRRDLHRHPEASMKEYRTTEKVCEKLDEIGVSYRRTGEVGVIAEIQGELGAGPTVMLRADMDALNIEERSGVDFASEEKGFMHACGHDTHTAMLLGSVKVLNQLKKEFAGTVRFVFQPGEEVAQGAKYMISHGALDNVDMCFGMHIHSPGGSQIGGIMTRKGAMFAACDMFKITVHGMGTHGCIPHRGADAVVAGASIVMNLQTMVSREFDPMEPVIVTVGSFHSGTRFNIVADTVEMTGTCRSFNKDIYNRLPEVMERIAKQTAEALKCTAEVTFSRLTSPLINDDRAFEIMKGAEAKVIPAEMQLKGSPSTGGEDFAEYMKIVPGVFVKLAAGGEYPMHNAMVCFDERSFENGICLEVQFALDALERLKNDGNE